MTEQEIRDMKPGRELDALVAKAMGWTNFSPIDPNCDHAVGVDGYRRNFALDPSDGKQKPFPLYSTDISAAWEVYEKVDFECEHSNLRHGKMGAWSCTFDNIWFDGAHTAPEAICKAALLALRGGEQE